jgi:GNAT superfamily N-acetyltransferase
VIDVEQTPVEGLAEYLELRNRVAPDDPLDLKALVARRRRDPDHVDLLARVDGVAAGIGLYARVLDDPVAPIGRFGLQVLPELRRRGIGTALHRAVSDVAREHADEELECQVIGDTPTAQAYAAARGYREVERMVESRLDLTTPSNTVLQAPSGVRFASAAEGPQSLEDAYVVALEAEPDIPRSRAWVRPRDFDDWRAREIDDDRLVHEASLVLYVGDEPAAYGLVVLHRAGVGEHFATGVARAHRGRGLAYALKLAQVARAREAGLRELVAWNDVENAPIRRVNARLGYRAARDVVTYRGPLL